MKFDIEKTFDTESKLQKYCIDYCNYLRQQGNPVYVINVPASSFGKRGISDLLLCVEGAFVAVELKNGKNNKYKATELQQRFLDNIDSCGGYAKVIYSFKEFRELLFYVMLDDVIE